MFITFEGPEGGGKTTQIRLLAAVLTARGRDVVLTREPGGTSIGDAVRQILLDPGNTAMTPRAETLLFNAARAQLVEEVIRPALAAGKIVLCDRFADSTLAYQGYGHGQALGALGQLVDYATGGLKPDYTILLDIEPVEGLRRKRTDGGEEWNRIEEHDLAFHQTVREGYLALARAEPARWRRIDATQDVEIIQCEILKAVGSEAGL